MGAAKIYFIIFGILTIAGGVVGYVKAGSLPSIIAGSITGVLLLVAGFLLPEHRAVGLATAFVISLLLAAQFIPKFIRTGKVMPAGMMSILSAIGIVVALFAWMNLDEKVIAWQEFVSGRGGGSCWFCWPQYLLRLFIAGFPLSGFSMSRQWRS